MKKKLDIIKLTVVLIGLTTLVYACSTQKANWTNVQYHNTTAHYNTWWNGNESLKQGVEMLEKNVKDDYTRLLPVYKLGTKEEAMSLNPQFDRAIEKSVKGIKKHSIFINGMEHVPYIPKCYMMMAYATFYKHDYVNAASTCQMLVSQYQGTEIGDEAAILYARCSSQDQRYQDAESYLDELVTAGRLEEADSLAAVMLAGTRPEEHRFAIYAFERSVIAERLGRPAERLEWLIKSAESDIINAVKDYASLTLVSQIVLPTDVERSFRYLRIAQEDAIAYNAKLRPWQIAQFFMEIEDAYSARQERMRRATLITSFLLAVLSVLLIVLMVFLVRRSRKLAVIQQDLQERNLQLAAANEQLEVLNRQLARADRVKERHLVDFLRRFSDNVSLFQSEDNRIRNMLKQGKADQLLRELSLSSRSEKGLKEFYRIFDATFLGICPDFVERFNELLREDARFSPREGALTTELRIFALIRLGVEDSREIASLLHYSQSTIYNYKVSVKNVALGDRDRFEEQVRQIAM